MKEKSIYNDRKKIEGRKKNLEVEIELLEMRKCVLQSFCDHKIVFEFGDNKNHKIANLHHLICPTCLRQEDVFNGKKVEDTCFNNSKIVDLTNIKFDNIDAVVSILEEELIDNSTYYYDDKTKTEDIKNKLIKSIK